MKTEQLYGLVLCGGKSTRMGTDKGLLSYQSNIWAKIAYKNLSSAGLKSYISVNQNQVDNYSAYFDTHTLITDNVAIEGPLKGVLSAHILHPNADWLITTADMPLLTFDIFTLLSKAYTSNENALCYVFENENFIEPFPGIYRGDLLKNILERHASNKLNNVSMQALYKSYTTIKLPLNNGLKPYFKNFNTLDDIQQCLP